VTPSLYAVVILAGLLAFALVGWATVEDRRSKSRADRFRRFGGELPTIGNLPRSLDTPTAIRRR
jgi:hypothetical protein